MNETKAVGTFVMEIEFESIFRIDDCHNRCVCVIDLAVVRCTAYSVMKCRLPITSVLFYWWSDRFCFLCFSFFVFVFVLSSFCVLCPTLQESLDCLFIFFAPLMFSNIYLALRLA